MGFGIAAAALAVAGAVAIWSANRGPQPLRLSGEKLISSFPGSHHSATFSPDGERIAFLNSGAASVVQVWVKNLAQGDPLQITFGGVDAVRPRWSARNDQIVFERRGQGIWSVPLPLGGGEHLIIEDGRNANLSRDGSQLVFMRQGALWTARADGSEQHRVAGSPNRCFALDSAPAFSPDGRWLAFFCAQAGRNGDIWVIPAAGGQARKLTFDERETAGPVWTADGRSILFSSAREGSLTLWRVRSSGGVPQPVTTGAGEDIEPAISMDGRKLIYTNVRTSWSVMLRDPVSGAAKELLSQRETIGFPTFSPDGERIAFFRHVNGEPQLFVVSTDTGAIRQVTGTRGEENVFPEWSVDGGSLFFYQVKPAPAYKKLLLSSGNSYTVAPWAYGKQHWARVDPGERAAVYTNIGAKGPVSTIVRDLGSGQERPLALTLTRMQWSGDGQFISGETLDGRVALCPKAGSRCTVVTAGLRPKWSGDGSRLYFLRATERPGWFATYSAALDGSDARRIDEIGPFRPFEIHFDMSRRGHAVWAPMHSGRHELWLADLR